MGENVRVVVRCRPMNKKENAMKSRNIIQIEDCAVTVQNPADVAAPAKTFTYDNAYDAMAPTEALYNDICYALVENVLEGYNGTIFAYGQTGCGKSHTMQGPDNVNNNVMPSSQRGIISRSFDHIFEAISVASGVRYLAIVSYLEIYNENIRDLLNPNENTNHSLKELPGEGVIVPTLSTHAVHNAQECEQLLSLGGSNRVVGSTLMNAGSSRSHSIFTISLEHIEECGEDAVTDGGIKKGKLNLVDLAGSERQNKTGAAGERLKEATKINLSLSALGNVISALVDGKTKHIPYRDSKLTRLLQDSLGGNTKTLMIACISPADYNYDETISTLRYASRAKNISNKPKINEDPKDAMLREYQEEILKLKKMLNDTHTNIEQPIAIENGSIDETMKQKWIENEKMKLQQEMEQEMSWLKEDHLAQQKQKEELVRDMEHLRNNYEQQLKCLTPQTQTTNQLGSLIKSGSERTQHIVDGGPNENEVQQLEARKRIELIKNALIGGERANDTQLKERRQKKKLAAQRRLSALAHVLSRVEQSEDRDLLQGHYTNIQHELNARNESLKTCRQKVKALEREVSDLQAEFQLDRADYLESIRRLERSLKFYQQLLEKALPILRKDGKYWDPDEILHKSTWNDDLKNWKLPESSMNNFRLPPAISTNSSARTHNFFENSIKLSTKLQSEINDISAKKSIEVNVEDASEEVDNLQKQTYNENILNNYFRPNRQRASDITSTNQKKGADYWKRVLVATTSKQIRGQNRALSSWTAHNHDTIMNKTWGGAGDSPLFAALHNNTNETKTKDLEGNEDNLPGINYRITQPISQMRLHQSNTLAKKTILSPMGKMDLSLLRKSNVFNRKPNSYIYIGQVEPNMLTLSHKRRPRKVAALEETAATKKEDLVNNL